MELVSSIAFVCFFSALYKLYRRFSRISLVHIPGPEPDSFLLGKEASFSFFSYYAGINQRLLSRKLWPIFPVTSNQSRFPTLAYTVVYPCTSRPSQTGRHQMADPIWRYRQVDRSPRGSSLSARPTRELTIINPQADYLFVSDPKAMQHILTSGYDFQKPPERREVSRMHSGRGIIWADGTLSLVKQYPQPYPQPFPR